MSVLSTIVPDLISNITYLIPFRMEIIHTYEQGVKFRFGKDINRCNHRTGIRFFKFSKRYPWIKRGNKTGVHFYWAFLESIEVMPCKEITRETQYQTVLTKDGKEVSLSLAFTYEIFNVRWCWTRVTQFQDSMENRCQGTITEVISKMNFSEITQNQAKINKKIFDRLNQEVYDWGVKVTDVKLINTAPARSIRLLSNEMMNRLKE